MHPLPFITSLSYDSKRATGSSTSTIHSIRTITKINRGIQFIREGYVQGNLYVANVLNGRRNVEPTENIDKPKFREAREVRKWYPMTLKLQHTSQVGRAPPA